MILRIQSTINTWLEKSNTIQFILMMLVYFWVLHLLSVPLLIFLDKFKPHESFILDLEPVEMFILLVLAAPFIETVIYQFGIIELLRFALPDRVPGKKKIIILVSAVVFAVHHLGAYSYATAALIGGIVFGQTYFIAYRKKVSPFLCTFSVHSLINLFVFIVIQLAGKENFAV